MTTEDIIILIFCYVDDRRLEVQKHGKASLYPGEGVTIGILFALKGGRFRAFDRWLKRDDKGLFCGLPDRTCLQRLLQDHQIWSDRFLETPSFFTVAYRFPIDLIFPIRQERSAKQLGKKNKDKGRWSMGLIRQLCSMSY